MVIMVVAMVTAVANVVIVIMSVAIVMVTGDDDVDRDGNKSGRTHDSCRDNY